MKTAKPGDVVKFKYPGADAKFDCELLVESVTGYGPEDLVFFTDGTHSKQKNLPENKE